MWIKFTQRKNFPEVIRAIENNKNNSTKDNLGVEKDKDGDLQFQSIETSPKLLGESHKIKARGCVTNIIKHKNGLYKDGQLLRWL